MSATPQPGPDDRTPPLGIPAPPPATEERYGGGAALPGQPTLPLRTEADLVRAARVRPRFPEDADPLTPAERVARGADRLLPGAPVPAAAWHDDAATVQIHEPEYALGSLLAVRGAPAPADPLGRARPDTVVLRKEDGTVLEADVTATTHFFLGDPPHIAAVGGARECHVGAIGARRAAAFLAELARALDADPSA